MLKNLLTKLIPLFVVILLSGCGSFEQSVTLIDKRPELIYQAPLPPIPWNLRANEFNLEARMLLDKEGSILAVHLMNSTHESEWDSLVIKQIKKWKFSPAVYKGENIVIWLRQVIKVSLKERFKFHIAEIVLDEYSKADSVYHKLLAGENFDSIVSLYSVSKSQENKGDLGIIDIRRYPPSIQEKICTLFKDDFTLPIAYKNKYYIFKRND